jgi:hypothetical protein
VGAATCPAPATRVLHGRGQGWPFSPIRNTSAFAGSVVLGFFAFCRLQQERALQDEQQLGAGMEVPSGDATGDDLRDVQDHFPARHLLDVLLLEHRALDGTLLSTQHALTEGAERDPPIKPR